ncbi:MAG: tRNA glutamyl-Q(34) synthetase GluQRS [Verrucomicrobiales bacterium]
MPRRSSEVSFPCSGAGSARTRFAPSPSGLLHLGHAYSALIAWDAAGRNREQFILRIEDIDSTRCKVEFEDAIYEDLNWLGMEWCLPVMRQSERLEAYAAGLQKLQSLGVVYPCFCTRRDIQEEIARSANAPHGPDGALYPGICRALAKAERNARLQSGEPHAWRLDSSAAISCTGPLQWTDQRRGSIDVDPALFGDVVIARKDIGTSYHLAVVIDDAAQSIELITRGEDLFHATHVHRILQELLGLLVPKWNHHALIADENGERLAKRNDARAVRAYRDAGMPPEQVVQLAKGSPTS